MRTACFVSDNIPLLRPYVLAPAAMFIARVMLLVLGFVKIDHIDWRRLKPHASVSSGAHSTPRAQQLQTSLAGDSRRENQHLGNGNRSRGETPVVVCNHVSWLDILVLQIFYAAAFVTRAETGKAWVIGGICDALPCIYVDRSKNRKKKEEPDEVDASAPVTTGVEDLPASTAASGSAASDAQSTVQRRGGNSSNSGASTSGRSTAEGGVNGADDAKSTTDKVVERINAKQADRHAPLRPLVAFVEVCCRTSRRCCRCCRCWCFFCC